MTGAAHKLQADGTPSPHSYLSWPFFEPRHQQLAVTLDAWATDHVRDVHTADGKLDVDGTCRTLVRALGRDGWLRHAVGGTAFGGAGATIDTRSICLIRETLAQHSGLADFAFAMQGLGSGAISLAGSDAQKAAYLPRVAAGEAIAAFALSEPNAGSDVAALSCTARYVSDPAGDYYLLDGEKTWISNGGIADFYVVFVRTGDGDPSSAVQADDRQPKAGEADDRQPKAVQPEDGRAYTRGTKGISALIVDANLPGFEIAERIDVIAPHPLARLRFSQCRVPVGQRIGAEGEGFKIAMRTLDVFRTSVAAAALGFGRHAMAQALERARTRRMFNGVLADYQLTQAKLADMATTIDSAALLTYRAAWLRDTGATVTREAAMAKMVATEGAQQVIDAAVQIWGGMGVVSEVPVEKLYREIRALRIYEGATEVQQMIIAREMLKD